MQEIIITYLKTFCVGGAICVTAQLLINYTKITAGKILVYFMLAGLFLQSVGLYKYLVDFAESGATVPISGFGYLLANGAIKGARESLVGALTGGMKAASAGITAAVVFSFLNALIFKPKAKKN
ncbi:MAG: SpoVA/SpoVAEb family sporulation membrane protein [Candidatus Borkfalkiaceae bacterium]|nr:SpoVA/SpoVAEb family sporulation membrane protein [Christensenellaceae bacterium]